MVNRRGFLAAAGACLIGRRVLAAAPSASAGDEAAEAGLRTLTYNLYGCKGWPERKGNRVRLAAAQPQLPERIALEVALYGPHILTFSEAPEEDAVRRIAARLDMAYAYYPSPEGFPGALVTRFPLLESRNCPLGAGAARPAELFTRHFGRAVLRMPEGELVLCSAHLHPNSSEIRLREIAAIVDALKPDREAKRSLLIQGDLNHAPGRPEYEAWRRAGLIDAQAIAGTVEQGTVSSLNPARRIDYVWMYGPIADRLLACRPLFEGAFRLNRDDPAAFALSDHLPVLAVFR